MIKSSFENLKKISENPRSPEHDWRLIDQALPPFLRAILLADGTVTSLLSAYMGEDIEVITTQQNRVVTPIPLKYLKLNRNDEAFFRKVELLGKLTRKCYASAESILNPSLIGDRLFNLLIDEAGGMGEVLRNSASGSYREILDIPKASRFSAQRTYGVLLEKVPSILITEKFLIKNF